MGRGTRRPRGVTVKTPEQVALMRDAGLVVARTLQRVQAAVAPGVTTGELDRLAEESIRGEGAVPSFLGYHGFSGSICASAGAESTAASGPSATGRATSFTAPSNAAGRDAAGATVWVWLDDGTAC